MNFKFHPCVLCNIRSKDYKCKQAESKVNTGDREEESALWQARGPEGQTGVLRDGEDDERGWGQADFWVITNPK